MFENRFKANADQFSYWLELRNVEFFLPKGGIF